MLGHRCSIGGMASRNRKPRRKAAPTPRAVLAQYPKDALPQVDPQQVQERITGLFTRLNVSEMFNGPTDPFRQRLLTIEVMMLCLLQFVLARMPSFREVVRLLTRGKIEHVDAIDVTPQAFCKRLTKIPHALFLHALQQTGAMLKKKQRALRSWVADLAPWATGVFAIDDTSLDAIARKTEYFKPHPKGDPATLGGRLACAIDLVTGKFEHIVYDTDGAANEKSHVRPLISALPTGALMMLDLGYFCFPLFDWITANNRYFITRMRTKISYETICALADKSHYRDRIIWLGAYRGDRAARPVRYVEILLDGKWWGYVTNVLDPSRLNAEQIWRLYAQRWTIEMCFAAIKRSLRLAWLRPAAHNAMLSQIWATLTVYQVLQDLRLEAAQAAGWQEDDVSWEMLMRKISDYTRWPPPGQTLRQWLCSEDGREWLKKSGTRRRRITELPRQVQDEALPPPDDPTPEVKAMRRKPRQGDPTPLKNPSKLLKVTLS
jgi:hypothetical protein